MKRRDFINVIPFCLLFPSFTGEVSQSTNRINFILKSNKFKTCAAKFTQVFDGEEIENLKEIKPSEDYAATLLKIESTPGFQEWTYLNLDNELFIVV